MRIEVTHAAPNTLLGTFVREDLGLGAAAVRSPEGIERGSVVFAQKLPNEPVMRAWSTTQSTYEPREGDGKRPDCLWSTATQSCSFESWLSDTGSRFNWALDPPNALLERDVVLDAGLPVQ